MKKFFIITCLVIAVFSLKAQEEIIVRFTSTTLIGAYCPFNAVNVSNQSRGWDEVLYYPDTTLSLACSVGVSERLEISPIAVHPNPFSNSTNASFSLETNAKVKIQLLQLNGKEIASFVDNFEAGEIQIRVAMTEPQIALLVITTANSRQVAKILNVGNGNCNVIEATHYASKKGPDRSKANFIGDFMPGDTMRYEAVTYDNGNVLTSEIITKAQYEDETIVLEFVVTTPEVNTFEVSNITQTSALGGGEVTLTGGLPVNERGICWGTTHNPTINQNHNSNGSGIGGYSVNMNGLVQNTTYYVRAYAINDVGISYGQEVHFTTLDNISALSVTTSQVTNISQNTAVGGGNVTADGGANVTERGICWNTSHNPTINNSHGSNGSGLGNYTVNMTGLSAGTAYYVRAYAINSQGISYGQEVGFTTTAEPPSVTTSQVTNITQTSATGGGNVTSDGGATVTERGICWSTSHNPTTSGSHGSSGTGMGNYTVSMTGLTANTTYYVRAYATNSAGTAYGSEVSFTTSQVATYNITVSANPSTGGSVSGGGTYQQGQSCTVTATEATGYSFYRWTENGTQVSTNASYTFMVNGNRALVANFTVPTGAINGKFTINTNGDKVYFSQGNLQYQASTNTWRFAENQYYCIDNYNSYISSSYSGWIDLFGWSTSGYNHGAVCYQPWSTSTDYDHYYAYGSMNCNLFDQTGQADWGYNPISNGGNTTNTWRTLTINEWSYVLGTRITPSGIRYAKAKVNNMNGVILLPDDWNTSYYSLSGVNMGNTSYDSNVISASQWTTLEQHGAVFLPAAGLRFGTEVYNVGSEGQYWSASYYDAMIAGGIGFDGSNLWYGAGCGNWREFGQSIRLVCPAEYSSQLYYSVSVSSNPVEGGMVNGDGIFLEGETCTVSAIPNTNYTFVNWTENGSVVSSSINYTFIVTNNRTLVANFNAPTGAINGKYTINSSGGKVYFSQGNLQYRASTNSWQFAENQYDCIGNANSNISPTYSGWIDLFGWGTSGWNNGNTYFHPWDTNENDYYYGPPVYHDLTGYYANSDWGVYNTISNGGNNQWRTLTQGEWDYVFNTRSTSSGKRYAKAKVNNVNGVILLPDNWNTSTFNLLHSNENGASFNSNVLTASQWVTLENAGAVFLPAAGSRSGTTVGQVGSVGYYWSASCYSEITCARLLFFVNSYLITDYENRAAGCSVRLVCHAD